jgi:hypothetical protein
VVVFIELQPAFYLKTGPERVRFVDVSTKNVTTSTDLPNAWLKRVYLSRFLRIFLA